MRQGKQIVLLCMAHSDMNNPQGRAARSQGSAGGPMKQWGVTPALHSQVLSIYRGTEVVFIT